MRWSLIFEEFGDFVDIFIGGPGTLDALGAVLSTFGGEKHVTLAEELLGTRKVEDDARFHRSEDAESDTRRDVALNKAGDNFDDWFLSSENEMHTGGTTELSDTNNKWFELFAGLHHEVGHFVNNNDDVGHFAVFVFFPVLRGRFFGHLFIVIGDGFNAFVGHEVVAAIHFAGGPFHSGEGFFSISNDRG